MSDATGTAQTRDRGLDDNATAAVAHVGISAGRGDGYMSAGGRRR